MITKISHHPDAATLMSFAAGSLLEPLAAGVSAHLSMCAACRAEVSDMELIGAELFRATPVPASHKFEVAMPSKPQDSFTRADAPARRAVPDNLPVSIARKYGLALDTIPWKPIGNGIWHHRLALSPGAEGDLRLFKFAAGRKLPLHGHGGSEFTLVIEGAFADETGEYRRGDVQDINEETQHQPVANEEFGCICLIASTGRSLLRSGLA